MPELGNYIYDTANARTTATVGGAAGQESLSSLPLGVAAGGEVFLKVGGATLADAVAAGVAGGSGATRTLTITTPSTGATIAAGKRYIEFIFSADFAGTIGGQTFSGATDSSYNLPLLNGLDTYAALVYTISAGSARLTTLV